MTIKVSHVIKHPVGSHRCIGPFLGPVGVFFGAVPRVMLKQPAPTSTLPTSIGELADRMRCVPDAIQIDMKLLHSSCQLPTIATAFA